MFQDHCCQYKSDYYIIQSVLAISLYFQDDQKMGHFGWLVSHAVWRLIEIIWLYFWSRIGGATMVRHWATLQCTEQLGNAFACVGFCILHWFVLHSTVFGAELQYLCIAFHCIALLWTELHLGCNGRHIIVLLLASFFSSTFAFDLKKLQDYIFHCRFIFSSNLLSLWASCMARIWCGTTSRLHARDRIGIVASGRFSSFHCRPPTSSPPWNFCSSSHSNIIIFTIVLIHGSFGEASAPHLGCIFGVFPKGGGW